MPSQLKSVFTQEPTLLEVVDELIAKTQAPAKTETPGLWAPVNVSRMPRIDRHQRTEEDR